MDDRPLVITADDTVLDEVLRVAAAAGVEVRHDREPGEPRRVARRARRTDRRGPGAGRGRVPAAPPDRRGRGPVGRTRRCGSGSSASGSVSTAPWCSAPTTSIWSMRCPTLGGRSPGGGRHIAVVGACGGAGARCSGDAVAIAAPCGPGARCCSPTAIGGVRVWMCCSGSRPTAACGGRTWPRRPVDWSPRRCTPALPTAARAARSVPAALSRPGHRRRGQRRHGRRRCSTPVVAPGDVTVLDLPRHPDPAADRVVEQADLTVVIVPADVRGCFAAGRLVGRLTDLGARIGLVVRGPSPGGLGPTTWPRCSACR